MVQDQERTEGREDHRIVLVTLLLPHRQDQHIWAFSWNTIKLLASHTLIHFDHTTFR